MNSKAILSILSTVLLGTALTTVIVMRNKTLGNININVPDNLPQTAVTEVSFKGSTGGKIRISLNTNVKSGTVNFVLYNSKGGIVENLGTAKAYQGFVNIEYDDTYTLAAEYENFTGKFSVYVYQS